MGGGGSTPEQPDPAKIIPLQTKASKDMFDYSLQGSRTNSVDPYGTNSWSRTPNFDQAGFDKAMADYAAAGGGAQTWVPPSVTGYGGDNGDIPQYGEGHWSDGSANPLVAPKREDFERGDTWTNTKELSPEMQAIFNANTKSAVDQSSLLEGATKNVADTINNPIDFSQFDLDTERISGIPDLSGVVKGYNDEIYSLDPNQINEKMIDAMYSQGDRFLRPEYEQEDRIARGNLLDQGFQPGTDAYNAEMRRISDSKTKAYGDLRDRSIVAGTNAGNQAFQNKNKSLNDVISNLLAGDEQDFDQRLRGQESRNDTLQQMMKNAVTQKTLPLDILKALRGGTEVTMPGGNPEAGVPGIDAPDISKAYNDLFQGETDIYNAKTASSNSNKSTAASLALAAAMFF
jgi:hypothetical protein